MIIGTAGHIDHGKTALVRALTGTDADRLAEEKARGITIDLGFAYADLGGGSIAGFVDVPGHEKLIHTMLAGAGGIDFALLVVAADDGVMPQTREHVAILDLLGIQKGIVVLTKADLAGQEQQNRVREQIRAMLAPTGLRDAAVMAVSSLTGEGIAGLRLALIEAEAGMTSAGTGGLLRFSVDRSFTLAGTGTVVTGMVLAGQVSVDDIVTLSPSGLSARIRGLHAQNIKAQQGVAGQRCALNLAGDGMTREAVHRGDMILAPALHAPTQRIDAELLVLATEPKPLGNWFPVRLHSHALEVGARIVPLEGPLAAGERGFVQLVPERPIAVTVGERFILRDTSASRTVGGGRFLDLRAPARRRRTAARMAWLGASCHADPAVALKQLVETGPVDLPAFLRDRGLPDSAGAAIVSTAAARTIGQLALSAGALQGLYTELTQILTAFHAENPDNAGIGREKLRLSLSPRLPGDIFLIFLRDAVAAGQVVLDGAFVRLPGHEVKLSPADQALWQRIEPCLHAQERFRPPRVRDLAADLAVDERDVRRVLRLTQKLGWTDQIRHDHFFAREVTRQMVMIIGEVAAAGEEGWFTAPSFRDRVQNGRKVAIEILEFFDRLGVTLRRGDLRRVNPHRFDLFGLDPQGNS